MHLRSLVAGVLMVGLLASIVGATAQSDLEAAAAQGRTAFILVVDQGTEGAAQARELILAAMTQAENSTLVELDRTDPQNADLVAKIRVSGARVPLILVAASNGVIAGGLPASQATAENLLAMVPSPKKAEVLQALQAGKAVFINVSRQDMAAQSSAMANCAAACGQMNDQGVTIEIDPDDPRETGFLEQLKVDRAANEPVTLVINAKGQITQTYTGATDVGSLVTAATKSAGGCCPPTAQGSSKSCGPKK